MSLFHPFKIVTCTGVDLNFITFIDEDGYFDFQHHFQSCILVTLVAVSPLTLVQHRLPLKQHGEPFLL